jgi:hypothetical protein
VNEQKCKHEHILRTNTDRIHIEVSNMKVKGKFPTRRSRSSRCKQHVKEDVMKQEGSSSKETE